MIPVTDSSSSLPLSSSPWSTLTHRFRKLGVTWSFTTRSALDA